MAASGGDLRPVFDVVTERALALCHGSVAVIWRVDGDVVHYEAGASTESAFLERFAGRPMPLAESFIVKNTVERRAPFHVTDALTEATGKDGRASVALGNYRTALGLPLMRYGEVAGVLSVTREEIDRFTPEEIEVVSTFADQVMIAMEVARLMATVERQRSELSRYLSPQVAQLVASDAGKELLDGHRRQITVAFCDLRGFTAFSESAEPEEVLGVLRQYHAMMGEVIVEHQGTLEHFAGDGMMVFFNDPAPVQDHELAAVRMAITMRERFDAMAVAWRKKGYDLGFGVGIAVGHATLGRIGFEGRYDYGAIGNVVILASRLASEAKPGEILISQRVFAATEGRLRTDTGGELTLKGFSRPVPALNVIGLSQEARA